MASGRTTVRRQVFKFRLQLLDEVHQSHSIASRADVEHDREFLPQ
jgi:hypothetical protein